MSSAAHRKLAAPAQADDHLTSAYLELLKRSLTGAVHQDLFLLGIEYHGPRWNLYRHARRALRSAMRRRGIEIARHADRVAFERGEACWPLIGETMVGLKRLENVQECIEDVLAQGVGGDLIETGVWRGGTTIFMRGVLKAHGVTDRTVWVADSFAGLPPPDGERYPSDLDLPLYLFDELAVGIDDVRENFDRYGLLDAQVRFLPGWFRDTLPTVAKVPWSIVRLDGDMYESTMDSLVNLYPSLSVGGYLIVDDGSVPQCMRAIGDYRSSHGITEPIRRIDSIGVYWRRER